MSKTFKDFRLISESFRNFIGPESVEDREIWADRAWEILTKTYAKVGGIKGKGFANKQDMIDNIPFWKLYVDGDKVLVAVFYKDKGGRKMVAVGTDPKSKKARTILTSIFKEGLKITWGEKSKALLNYLMTNLGIDVIRPFLIRPAEVEKLIKKEVRPVTPEELKTLSPKDISIYDKFKNDLGDYFYIRDIKGEPFLKVSFGTPGKNIK